MNWVDSFYPIQLEGYCMENMVKGNFFDRVLEVLKNSKTGKNGIRYFYGLFLL